MTTEHPAQGSVISSIESSPEALLQQLITQYGQEQLQNYFLEVTSLSQELNQKITQLDQYIAKINQDPSSTDPYNQKVFELAQETSKLAADYYQRITDLPEDIRKFLLSTNFDKTEFVEQIFQSETTGELLKKPVPAPPDQLLKRLLPALQVTRPKAYVMPVDAISNRLAQLRNFNRINVSSRKKNTVYTAVTIDSPAHMQIDGNLKLTNYDKSIINGVASILESGNTNFTIPMLYHAMTGKENPSLDAALIDELRARLDIMRRLMITIDLTEEVKEHLIGQLPADAEGIESFTIEGSLLPLNKYTGIINGQKSELYQIIDTPPLHNYAKMKNQIATVPISLLKAPLNNNNTTIPLKNYLITRIEGMKNPHNRLKQNKILFESIYRELGVQDRDKKIKKRIRDYTEIILKHFISEGYIRQYDILKEGRTIRAVQIYWTTASSHSEQPKNPQ